MVGQRSFWKANHQHVLAWSNWGACSQLRAVTWQIEFGIASSLDRKWFAIVQRPGHDLA
ncbi:hypothetical protein ABIB56_002896 [Glaciihabitans sp. UYNi722]